MLRLDRWLVPLLCALTLAVIVGAIVLGPGDLYEKDQPKTIAYTADVVLHHRFALPRDVIYQPATKPPLYNWIGALFVVVTGSWSEFVLKLPSVLGRSASAGLCIPVAQAFLPVFDEALAQSNRIRRRLRSAEHRQECLCH